MLQRTTSAQITVNIIIYLLITDFLEVAMPGQSIGKILRLLMQTDKLPTQKSYQFIFYQQ